MSRTTVTFDGQVLTSDYIVSDLRRPLLPREVGAVDVAGRDGSIYTGAKVAPRDITLTLTAKHDDIAQREAAARRLAGILAVDEPKALAISIDGGIRWVCVPTSTNDADRYSTHTSFEVSFRCLEAAGRGDTKTVTVPSGGSVTFDVDGTYPTRPTIAAAAAMKASAGYWRVQFEGLSRIIVVPDDNSTHRVEADCERRVLTVDGAVAMLDPSSDWPVLAPGEHTATMTGTGAATITYEERWL